MFSKSFYSTLFFFILLLASGANASTLTVSKTADTDDGVCNADCSLREAVTAANDNGAGADTINFAIPGGGVHTINIIDELPAIQSSLTINGATQSGYFGMPMIEISGELSPNSNGIRIRTGIGLTDISVTIIGLAINRHLYGVDTRCFTRCDVTLLGNFIGTDPTGTIALGNSWNGVNVDPSNGSIITIGGSGIFEGNLISGNGNPGQNYNHGGINIAPNTLDGQDLGTAVVKIIGNKIGTDFGGTVDLGNGENGITVTERDVVTNGEVLGLMVTIGGSTSGARNLISGNEDNGIYADVSSLTVLGNYIGTNAAGSSALPNGDNGFWSDHGIHIAAKDGDAYVIGGDQQGEGNVISGNLGTGIYISTGAGGQGTAQLAVQGNYVGTNADGTGALPNDGDGISIDSSTNYTVDGVIGGATPGSKNIISGNDGNGITVGNANLAIYGNYIGTDKTGSSDLGNSFNGVSVIYDADVTVGGTVLLNGSPIDGGNLISGNNMSGIVLSTLSNFPATVKRNKIGTDVGGVNAIPNSKHGIEVGNVGSTIGSLTSSVDGNLISGNLMDGIHIFGSGQVNDGKQTQIYANRIGTNGIAGSPLPNGQSGIEIDGSPGNQIGSASNGTGTNIISGNIADGILVSGSASTGNRIENNIIGTGPILNDLGNGGSGVLLTSNASGNFVGSSSGTGNTIVFNATGVNVAGGNDNEIRRNAIFSNDGLGIDLSPGGVTPNDAGDSDTGANRRQNFPLLNRATPNAISGTLNSTPGGNFTIDFYRVDSCDASGNGEGRYYLGSALVLTNGLTGDGSFEFPTALTIGQTVTATATVTNIIGADDTSEFSQCKLVSPAPTFSFSNSNYGVNEAGGARTIIVNRGGATDGVATVDYATSNGTASSGQDYTAANGTLTFGDGETIKTFDVLVANDTLDEADETINLQLSNPTGGAALTSPSSAILTIVDDDTAPAVTITDISASEGNAGTTSFTCAVQLSAASGQGISVDYATANGSATAGSDYVSANGQLNFAAGETSKNVVITVNGDLTVEPDENFFVNLSNAVNASISDGQGAGTIVNDDNQYSIRGEVRQPDNTPLFGVTLTLQGTQSAQTTTDANGRYVFSSLPSGGNYTVTASGGTYTYSPPNITYSNLAGNVTDANFTGTQVTPRQVQVIGGIAMPGYTGTITVELVSQGNEHKAAFSLGYDPVLLSDPQVILLPDSSAAVLAVDTSQSGKVGISVTLPAGQTYPAGTRQLVAVSFDTVMTNAASTPLTFGDVPTVREVLDNAGSELTSNYADGSVFFSHGYEADVSPRPTGTGDGTVNANDVNQIGRFVAGLDQLDTSVNEFQRADSAPDSTLGNGVLTVGDYTQAARYAAGMDTVVAAGGPDASLLRSGKFSREDDSKGVVPLSAAASVVRAVNASAAPGSQVTVSIETDAQGTENGFGFSIGYDTAKLSNPLVQNGVDFQTADLITNNLHPGKIGIIVALPSGQSSAAGTRQVVTVRFDIAANAATGLTPLTFGDLPAVKEVVDVNASPLLSTFQDGTVNILGPTAANVSVSGRLLDHNGRPVRLATVSITDTVGNYRTTLSNSFGYFRFEDIPVGETYTVAVRSKRFNFAPRLVTVMDEITDLEMVAEP